MSIIPVASRTQPAPVPAGPIPVAPPDPSPGVAQKALDAKGLTGQSGFDGPSPSPGSLGPAGASPPGSAAVSVSVPGVAYTQAELGALKGYELKDAQLLGIRPAIHDIWDDAAPPRTPFDDQPSALPKGFTFDPEGRGLCSTDPSKYRVRTDDQGTQHLEKAVTKLTLTDDEKRRLEGMKSIPKDLTYDSLVTSYGGEFNLLSDAAKAGVKENPRLAVAGLMGLTTPTSPLPDGLHMVQRNTANGSYLSVGCEGGHATIPGDHPLGYMQWDPKAGLIAPSAAYLEIHDQDDVGGFIAGAIVSIVTGGAGAPAWLAGGLSGAVSAAVNDQDILKGALLGAVSGGAGQASQGLADALRGASVPSFVADAAAGAATKAAVAAIAGGDPLKGALSGIAGAATGAIEPDLAARLGGGELGTAAASAVASGVAAAAGGANGSQTLAAAVQAGVGSLSTSQLEQARTALAKVVADPEAESLDQLLQEATDASPSSGPVTRSASPLEGTAPSGAAEAVRDPSSLFQDDYLRTLIGSHFEGENTQALHTTMETLNASPTGPQLESALQDLANLRGRPVEELRGEYQKYLELKDIAASRGYEREALRESTLLGHPNFMGSTNQLRYGEVVGDAFGVDPVFGALLNPSGGLVGPGNNAVDMGDSAVSYHGIVHDAAGYLYNAQGVGPGYDYLGLEGRDTSSPLTGQRAGIRHWGELTGDNGISTHAEAAVMDVVVGGVDGVNALWNTVKSIF